MTEPVIIGDATLYLGDAREVARRLQVDACITDPPYLDGDFSDLLPMLLGNCQRLVVTPGKLESFRWIRRFTPTWEYIWRGAQKSLGGRACLHIGFEPILSYGWPLRPLGNDELTFSIAGAADKPDHPWPKPIALIEKLVSHWSASGETILDPFMGSGTTGVACAKLGRKFIGVEIEKRYFDIACRRIEEAYRQPRLFADPVVKPKQEAML